MSNLSGSSRVNPLYLTVTSFCVTKGTLIISSSLSKHHSYIDSIRPGPLSRCTSIAAPMIVAVGPAALWKSGCISRHYTMFVGKRQRLERTLCCLRYLPSNPFLAFEQRIHSAGKRALRRPRRTDLLPCFDSRLVTMAHGHTQPGPTQHRHVVLSITKR